MREVHQRILDEHHDTVAGVVDAGQAVASAVDGWPVTDGGRIRRPLEALLRERGLLAPLVEVLTTGADTLDTTIQGQPVAAPPYLVVTSRGPLCRATLADGHRLVVELSLFAVDRRPREYRFRDPGVEECLQITHR